MFRRKIKSQNQTFELIDYKALLDVVGKAAMVSIANVAGDIIYVNDQFVEVCKYSRKELIGQNHRILKSGQQPQSVFEELWRTISHGKVWRGELKNKAKDGTLYWVDTSIVPILGKDNKPEKYLSVRMLITDKKQKQEEFEAQQQKLLSALEDLEFEKDNYRRQVLETQKFFLAVENSGEHIVITDPDGIVIYANRAAERMTGYTNNEMVGTKAGVLWGGQMESSFYRGMWKTIKTDKKIFTGEITNVRKGGMNYIAQATIAPVLNEKKEVKFFIGTERDVTIEKDIDRAKTEFVSLASHQLRTPLSAINWFGEMLLNGDAGKLTTEQKEYVDEIYRANQRMVKLINALLNVSRLELGTFAINPEVVNVTHAIKAAIQDVQILCDKRHQKLEVSFAKDLPSIMFDPQYLGMIILNLVTNACKYTPTNGSISVRVSIAQRGSKRADYTFPAKGIVIEVKDNGYGIPKNQQNKIFSKMFRADNVREKDTDGTGLGLYIIKSIIDHSYGHIWFTSKVNEGSSFYVYLPLKVQKRNGSKKIEST